MQCFLAHAPQFCSHLFCGTLVEDLLAQMVHEDHKKTETTFYLQKRTLEWGHSFLCGIYKDKWYTLSWKPSDHTERNIEL